MDEGRRNPRKSGFAMYAWLVLAYNILVILWGTVVRATGSGAGCGDHWPLCEGQVIPHAAQIATLIEFAHRVSSGLAVALVAGLVYFAFRRVAARHPARRYAAAALFFTLTEGLIGAALVLFGQAGNNVSTSRVCLLSLHMVNTFLLLASLALTAGSVSEGLAASSRQDLAEGAAQPRTPATGLAIAFAAGLTGTLAIAVTGTITALVDTLFPATSLTQGLQWDFSRSSNFLLRLRVIHPAIAVLVGSFLIVLAARILSTRAPASAKSIARYLLAMVVLQFCFGALDVVLLAPLWMQVLHLLTADLIWITLVLLSAALLGRGDEALPAQSCKPVSVANEASSVQRAPVPR